MSEHEAITPEGYIQFGTLRPDGTLTNERTIRQSDIAGCPHTIFDPEHYRADGTCKCDDPAERAKMIREWGYRPSDFREEADDD